MSLVNSFPNIKDHKIVVFGASGHTGRFVVSELARRGMTAILSGRDRKKLSAMRTAQPAFEVRLASVDDPVSLDRVLQDAALVINCAGPFLDTATPIIEAALRTQIHYVDVTAEQAVARDAFEKFSDAARKAGVLIVPSAAFYGALGDLLATTAVGGWPSADEVQIAVALDSWKPTHGTRLTGQRNPRRRLVFSKNRLSPVEDPLPKLNWNFPAPFGSQEMIAFPLAETILIARHIRVPEIHSYINLAPISDLHDPHTPAPTPADEQGRSAQEFVIEARVRWGNLERRAIAAGRDIYAVTAPIVVEVAERILAGSCQIAGTVAPGEIFDAESFLRALSPEHISLELLESRAHAS